MNTENRLTNIWDIDGVSERKLIQYVRAGIDSTLPNPRAWRQIVRVVWQQTLYTLVYHSDVVDPLSQDVPAATV